MKSKLFTLILAGLFTISATAQDAASAREVAEQSAKKSKEVAQVVESENQENAKHWKISGILSLNTSATAMVNWAAGGNNAVNGVAAANVSFLYKKGAIAWDSNIDTDYGLSYLSDNAFPLRKTNDKLNITTKFGWEFANQWYLTALGSFKTQYARGYNYGTDADGKEDTTYTSNIMSPSYTDLSVGIDWKPNDIFSVYISPVAGRITTTIDSELRSLYSVDELKNFRAEFGATLKAGVNYTLIKNLKVISTITLFTPYIKESRCDVDWDFSISYQFLKVLNVSLGTQLKYYDNVLIANKEGVKAPRVQFKSMLGLGIGYSF